MERQQKRLEYLDEQNKALEKDSVALPDKKKVNPDTIAGNNLFLRPPRGIPTQAVSEPDSIFATYRPPRPAGIKELSVAGINWLKVSKRDDFQKSILDALAVTSKPKTKELGERLGRKMSFEWYHQELPDMTSLELFFYKTESNAGAKIILAIAFRLTPGSKGEPIQTAIDYSLSSLAVGSEALSRYARAQKASMAAAPPATKPDSP